MTNLIDIFKRRLLVNSVFEGLFNSKKDLNILLTDGTNPVTPESVTVVGNDVEVEFSAGAAPSGRELMKTGQTTSYRTGDDGDLQEGRDVDFFTLDYTNPFGNTNRFTDEIGGTTYANNWVIDWTTYNTVTGKVLGWYRVLQVASIWNNAVDNALGSFGTFSNCRLPNVIELTNILNFGLVGVLSYNPFNIATGVQLATSTTVSNAPTLYIRKGSTNGVESAATKNIASNWIPVRTFTVTGTTLT